MKRFVVANLVIAIASRWWLVVLVLAGIGAALAVAKQMGSGPISWLYVSVCSIWGAGLGFLFVVGNINQGKGATPRLLSAAVVAFVMALTGWMLDWSLGKSVAIALGGAVLGLLATRWAPYINLG